MTPQIASRPTTPPAAPPAMAAVEDPFDSSAKGEGGVEEVDDDGTDVVVEVSVFVGSVNETVVAPPEGV